VASVTRRGWILFGTLGVLWGIPYLLIKVAVSEVSPALVVFGRTAIAAAILVPVAARSGDLRRALPHWRLITVFAAVEICGPWLLLGDAERRLTSSFAGLLVAAVPLVAAVLTPAFGGHDRLDASRMAGLAVGIGGVATLLGLDLRGEVGAGVEMGLVAVGYAIGPLMIARYFADLPSLGVMSLAFTISAVVYVPAAVVTWPSATPSAGALLSVVGLAVLCTVAAFLVFFALVAEVGPNRATVITFVNPAVAVLLGVTLRGEPLTAGILAGFPLVLLGCWLATRRNAEVAPAVTMEA
jgi:drug/metabolite transporter (DMT)-like permease